MTVITTSSPGSTFSALFEDQTTIIAPNVTIGAFNTDFTGTLLENYGTISSAGNAAVDFRLSTSGQFINKPGGTVTSGTSGVIVRALGDVVNQGVILGATDHGISLQGGANNNSVVNS